MVNMITKLFNHEIQLRLKYIGHIVGIQQGPQINIMSGDPLTF